jgi:tetratricopeptide (TPR) repeat protein
MQRFLVGLGLWIAAVLQVAAQSPLSQEQNAIESLLNENRMWEVRPKLKQYLATPKVYKKDEARLQADDQYWLGRVYLRLGELDNAKVALDQALTMRKSAYGISALVTGDVLVELGKVYLQTEEGMKAMSSFEGAHHIYIWAMPVDTFRLCTAKEYLGGIYMVEGKLDMAEAMYDSVLQLQAAFFGPESVTLATVLNCLGGVYLAQGRETEAMGAYNHALNLQTNFYGPEDFEAAVTHTNLGVLYDQSGDFASAERHLRLAYDIRAKHLSLTDALVMASLDNLVNHLVKRGAFETAFKVLKEAEGVRAGRLGADQPAVAEILDRQATVFMAWDRADAAEQVWIKALQIRENSLGSQHELVSANLYNLGKLENLLQKHDQARIHLNWALNNYEGNQAANEAQVTAILSELFICDFSQGKMDGAENHLLLMRTIKTEVYGPGHPQVRAVMEEQVKFYKQAGQDWKADQVEEELRRLTSGR